MTDRKPTTDEKRAAVDRMARRFSEESARQGRKLTHDQAMSAARELARKHDKRER